MSSRRDQPFQVSRHVSLWHATAPERGPDAPLSHDRRADVVIVGAGFTGLWTARSLLAAEPDLDVAVIDAAPEDLPPKLADHYLMLKAQGLL